jgi:hypothetical protein
VRLGRVICGTEEIFDTDCMLSGGHSGGPYFSLDGQLVGIDFGGDGFLEFMYRHDASFLRRRGGLGLWNVTGSMLIDSLLDAMRRGEKSPCYSKEAAEPGSSAHLETCRSRTRLLDAGC